MKLFNTIAYHSTTQKGLDKFKNRTGKTKAFKGEGFMVHGWGLYLQADKRLNVENYKNALGKYHSGVLYKNKIWKAEHLSFDDSYYVYDSANQHNHLDKNDYASKVIWFWYFNCKGFKRSDFLKYIDSLPVTDELQQIKQFVIDNPKMNWKEVRQEPSQYTVEIPEDYVFISETGYIPMELYEELFHLENMVLPEDFQNDLETDLKVYIRAYCNKTKFEIDEYELNMMCKNLAWRFVGDYKNKSYPIDINICVVFFYELSRRYNFPKVPVDLAKLISDCLLEHSDMSKIYDGISGRALYEKLSEKYGGDENATMYLMKHGIDGIKYYGEYDGDCYVIFNCTGLNIVNEEE